MRRRLLITFCVGLAGLILSAAALPWWLGAVFGWAGASRGLTFARYERIGYARFALHEAEFHHAAVRVTVSRIEADTPLVAWWRRGEILVDSWAVEVPSRGETPAAQTAARGWLPLQAILQRVAVQLDRWAPRVTIQAGAVRWPGAELTCKSARWAERALAVKALAWRELKADATLAFPADALRLLVRGTNGSALGESHGGELKGDLRWWDQRAKLTARFGGRGWLPTEAELHADDWQVPGEKLRLGELYTVVRGHGKIAWRAEKLSADFAATGEPVPGKSAPPLAVTLRGQGDTAAFTVESLEATLPGIAARLSAAVTVERSGKFRAGAAHFTVDADLAKLPWFAAQGTVTGEARLESILGQAPLVAFQLAARDVAVAGWAASLVEAQGQFDWPRIQVSAGTLAGTAGERLAWRGGWDFAAKEVLAAAAEGQIRRTTLARWLPADLAFEVVTLNAEAAGPLAELRHAGKAQVEGVTYRALNPLGLTLEWTGRGAKIDSFATEAIAGATKLSAAGVAARKVGGTSVPPPLMQGLKSLPLSSGDEMRLTRLALTQGDVTRLQLTEPARLQWQPTLQVDGLHLTGPESDVEALVAWGETGRVELAVKNFSSAWLAEFGGWRGPAWRLTSLAAQGAWERGPMTFSVAGTAAIELREGTSAVVAVSAQGDTSGLRIDTLSVVEDEKSVVRVVGRIPVRFSPGAAQKVEFAADGALALDVLTEPNASFWQELATLTGFELKEPEAVAQVTGTWARPQGTVRLKAARVAVDAARYARPLPTMEALELELAGDPSGIRLEGLAVKIEGQAVRARGRLPVADGTWRTLLENPLPWVQRGAEGRIEVPDAEVAALARFLPLFMAPKGRLQLDVSYENGALDGTLRLSDAATRPLGPLGVLQEINAEVAFVGRRLELRSVTAQSGGQTVTLSGTVALPPVAATAPAPAGNGIEMGVDDLKFEVALKGENLHFVRRTGMLVRGDLDLKLTSPARGAPRIAGTVRLRESLFLSDVRALLPGGARTKSRLPPYFAVEVAPYKAWRLEVVVQGERFLQLRTALFIGVASARFQLSGTLGEPMARGEATIDEGVVKLPFATFVVQEGRVSLTPEQGIEPQVWLVATVRRLSHDLRMEASGPASAPVLLFTSSPPMESGQVLLMVMTGESPREGMVYTDRQRMARLGTFLGQSLVASLGGESEAGERLSLSTGENVSRQGRETYGIEYRLSEHWSFVGEYDEFDEFNAGVKWRVFSRGGQREEQKK